MGLAAVFLDFGGTLVREQPSRTEIYAGVARARGVPVSTERMGELLQRAHAELPRELEGAFRYSDPWFRALQRRIFLDELQLPPELFEDLSEELFARFEDARTFVLFPGARELLAELARAGLFVALISNWSARLPRLLGALGLDSAFDLVLCSALERLEKPEPAIFRRALDRAGVPASRALHAGDQPERDARGALAAGLTAVLVDHAGVFSPAERSLCPCVSALDELARLILERA